MRVDVIDGGVGESKDNVHLTHSKGIIIVVVVVAGIA